MLSGVNGKFGTSRIISLMESVNNTSNTMASLLARIENSLKNQDLSQTTMLLSQLINTQMQMASTLTQMASTFNQVVPILQGKIVYITKVYEELHTLV